MILSQKAKVTVLLAGFGFVLGRSEKQTFSDNKFALKPSACNSYKVRVQGLKGVAGRLMFLGH
ncbi:hypothetical protein E5C31_03860 [Providencia rettgeri]|nr:hypothetical protein [Providencia rettgeri]